MLLKQLDNPNFAHLLVNHLHACQPATWAACSLYLSHSQDLLCSSGQCKQQGKRHALLHLHQHLSLSAPQPPQLTGDSNSICLPNPAPDDYQQWHASLRFMKVQATQRVCAATGCIVLGCIILITFGNHQSTTLTVQDMLQYYER